MTRLTSTGRVPAPTANDDVVMIALTPGALQEAQALRRQGVNVTVVKNETPEAQDTAVSDGRRHDLSTPAGRAAFARGLQVPPSVQARLALALADAPADSRDELGQLAVAWAPAERGQPTASRFLPSGHNVGDGPFGDDGAEFPWSGLLALAKAMPRAAAQVQDMHVSACYSGGDVQRELYLKTFPNLATVWAYDGSAPTGGAVRHQKAWEVATRGAGSQVHEAAERLREMGVRMAKNIQAYSTQAPLLRTQSIEQLRAEVDRLEPVFDAHFSGQQVQRNSQQGPLRDYYTLVQRCLQSTQLSGVDREKLEQRRDTTIRLLYYPKVAVSFAETVDGALRDGYAALGLAQPRFDRLSRSDALASIDRFHEALAAAKPPPEVAVSIAEDLAGLRDLTAEAIPEEWL